MRKKDIPILTEKDIRNSGITIKEVSGKMRTAFREMKVGDVYAFQGVVYNSLMSIMCMLQQNPKEPKKFKEIGRDPVNRIYYIKRIS